MFTLSSSSSSGTQRELADLPPGSTTPSTHKAATADFRIAQWKPIAFFALLIQLVGLCCVIHRYEIETNAFATLMDLSLVGFAIHYFLPQRLKMPFFLLL